MSTTTRLILSALLLAAGSTQAVLAGIGFFLNAGNTGDPVVACMGLLAIVLCAAATAVALADLWKPEPPTPEAPTS